MEQGDLARVRAWRNHPDVRRYMFTTDEIDAETHQRWFDAASCDPRRRLLIAEADGHFLGFVQFRDVEPGGIAHWGFYAVPGAPKGSGRVLGALALDLGFGAFELHKVCGEVVHGNDASLRFHRALGFRQEGLLREHRRIGDGYVDLVCFGLLAAEWRTRPGVTGDVADA